MHYLQNQQSYLKKIISPHLDKDKQSNDNYFVSPIAPLNFQDVISRIGRESELPSISSFRNMQKSLTEHQQDNSKQFTSMKTNDMEENTI